MNTIIEKLETMELGSKWENHGHSRFYINWHDLIGFEIGRYNTGNISVAYLQGEQISNNKAYKLQGGKVFINLKNMELTFQYVDNQMIELIREKLEELTEVQDD